MPSHESISLSCRGPSETPFSLCESLGSGILTGSGKAPHHPPPLINAGGCPDEPQEVQHSPPSLDIPHFPRQSTQSCAPSQMDPCALSETATKALIQASSFRQSSSRQALEPSFSQVPIVLPPETSTQSKTQSKIPIEAELTGRCSSHPSPHFSRTIYDVPSSLHHATEVKIAIQHRTAVDLNQEVRNTEVSPAMNVLPELGYPMMESPTIAEVEGDEMHVDEVDSEKEDEREECIGMSAEVARPNNLMNGDGDMVAGLATNDVSEEEMDVVKECVDEVNIHEEVDKNVTQQIESVEEVCVDVRDVSVPVQLQEKGGEEENEVQEEEGCPSYSAPSVYVSPKTSITPVRFQAGPHWRFSSPGTPKSARQLSVSQSLDQSDIDGPGRGLHTTSEEVTPIIAQLTTPSDPESEEEVDELSSSEPCDIEGTFAIGRDQTVVAKPPTQTLNQDKNSIHSIETVGPGVGHVDQVEREHARMRVDETSSEVGADHLHHLCSAQHQQELLYDDLMPSNPVVSPAKVIPITSPNYVSSTKMLSLGRLPALFLDARGGLSGKRKLEEINIGGTIERSQSQSNYQTLGDHIRLTIDLQDAPPSTAGRKQKDILPVPRGVSESDASRSRRESGNQEIGKKELKVTEKEESPAYISSSSSTSIPDKMKDIPNNSIFEYIDLTDSPPQVNMQAELVEEKESVMKQNDTCSLLTQVPSAAGPAEETPMRTEKTRKRHIRGRDKMKKRMAQAEKKKLLGIDAESSDEPDIRPARGLGLSDNDTVQDSGGANLVEGRTTQTTIPNINFAVIQARQDKSKARTRVRRRKKLYVNPSVSSATLFEEDSGDDRPLKKTRMQSKYIEPATVGTSSNQRKSARGEKLPSSTGSTGGNEAEEIATDQGQQLETVNLAYDVPGPSKRIKWPSKRIREMHDKNVSSLSQLVYLGIEDDLFISSSAVTRKRIGFTCEMIFERVDWFVF